jgi:hypothetical protein
MDFKFNIGDHVRIIDLGYMYDSDGDSAGMLKLTKWRSGAMPIMDDWQSYIPSQHEHENKGVIVGRIGTRIQKYGLRLNSDGLEYVIEEGGLELYAKPVLLDDSLFED